MKSIVIFALLALAAHSFTFNLTALGLGEATTLNLTEEQIQNDAIPCFTALSNDLNEAISAIQSRDAVLILSNIESWIDQVETDYKVTCAPYIADVVAAVNITPSEDLVAEIKSRFITYYPEVIQLFASFVNNIIAGNDYEAGVSEVTIVQILYGLIVPTTLPVPQVNTSLIVPFDQETFIAEFIPAFFTAIGDNVTINTDAVNLCVTDVQSVVEGIESLRRPESDVRRVLTIIDIISLGAESYEDCGYVRSLYAQVYAPIYAAFRARPVAFILQVLNSTASNAPQLVQLAEQEGVYIAEGEYALAGELDAQKFQTVYGFVSSN